MVTFRFHGSSIIRVRVPRSVITLNSSRHHTTIPIQLFDPVMDDFDRRMGVFISSRRLLIPSPFGFPRT